MKKAALQTHFKRFRLIDKQDVQLAYM